MYRLIVTLVFVLLSMVLYTGPANCMNCVSLRDDASIIIRHIFYTIATALTAIHKPLDSPIV